MCSMKFLKNKIFTLERKSCIPGICFPISVCVVFFPPLHSLDLVVNSKPDVKVHSCCLTNVGVWVRDGSRWDSFWKLQLGMDKLASAFSSRHAWFLSGPLSDLHRGDWMAFRLSTASFRVMEQLVVLTALSIQPEVVSDVYMCVFQKEEGGVFATTLQVSSPGA